MPHGLQQYCAPRVESPSRPAGSNEQFSPSACPSNPPPLLLQVLVGEPSVPDTINILRGLSNKYETHHG